MERLEIIDTLKDLTSSLERELAGLSDAVIRYKPSETEWSIREVMGHLSFAEDVWYKRLYQVWSLTDPMLVTFAGSDEAMEAARNATQHRPVPGAHQNQPPARPSTSWRTPSTGRAWATGAASAAAPSSSWRGAGRARRRPPAADTQPQGRPGTTAR